MIRLWNASIARVSIVLITAVLILAIALGFVSYQYAYNRILATTTLTVTQTVAQALTRTGQTASCMRVGEGWAFYIKVISDGSKTPVSGAKINARTYVHCGNILDNTNPA